MPQGPLPHDLKPVRSVCVFCGSSDRADPEYIVWAQDLGRALAAEGMRLVYGGGGVGLMGAAARAAHEAGGDVLGIMPLFLRSRERLFEEVETLMTPSMHQRKQLMYDESDAFVVAPGGVGTLEEVVEILSWKRLDLHDKPVIFLNQGGFWESLFALMRHTVDEGMTPASFLEAWEVCDTVDEVMAALKRAHEAPRLRHDRR